MILIYKDNKGKWHLLKSLGKSGLASINIKAHCGENEGADGIRQVPDSFVARLCKPCQEAIEKL